MLHALAVQELNKTFDSRIVNRLKAFSADTAQAQNHEYDRHKEHSIQFQILES